MQRLTLDFNQRRTLWPLPGVILMIAGVVLTALMVRYHAELDDELMQSESHLTRLKRDVERQRLFDKQSAAHPVGDNANGRIRRSRDQWEALFSGFETAADETVTLLSMEPGATEISVRGEAKDFAAMTDYVKRLSTLPILADVRLTDYEIARDHVRRPLRFSAKALWKDAPR
jgi:Tfp pilus assembly protein PilN